MLDVITRREKREVSPDLKLKARELGVRQDGQPFNEKDDMVKYVAEGGDDDEPLPAGGVNYKRHRTNKKNFELEAPDESEYYDEEEEETAVRAAKKSRRRSTRQRQPVPDSEDDHSQAAYKESADIYGSSRRKPRIQSFPAFEQTPLDEQSSVLFKDASYLNILADDSASQMIRQQSRLQNMRDKPFLSNLENAKILALTTKEKVRHLDPSVSLAGKPEAIQYQES